MKTHMDLKEFKKIKDQLTRAAWKFAKGYLDEESIKDIVQETFREFYEKRKQSVEFPKTYMNQMVQTKVKNLFKQKAQRRTDQLGKIEPTDQDKENASDATIYKKGAISKSPWSLTRKKQKKSLILTAILSSIIQDIKTDHPERYEALEKSLGYIELLYFLKSNRKAAEEYVLPYVRSMNALKEAKAKIDALARSLPIKVIKTLFKKLRKMHPMPNDFPDPSSELALLLDMKPLSATEMIRRCYETIKPYPKELDDFNRNYSFYVDIGWKISKSLEDQIGELHNLVAFEPSGPGTSPKDFFSSHLRDITELDDWIIDSIPKLRADPAMLILRVLYKMCRIGTGKYGSRKVVRSIILELKNQKKGTSQESLFNSISQKTNFETLRKKLYQKGASAIYDKLATHIYSRCFLKA